MSGTKDRKKTVMIVIWVTVLLLGAVAAGAFVRWSILQFSQQAVVDNNPKLPANVVAVRDLMNDGKPEDAETIINDSVNNPDTPNSDKELLYIQQGDIAAAQGDYDAALASYMKSYEINPNFDAATKLGTYYQQIGDNEKAIEFYKKSIELNPPENPMHEANNNMYKQMITILGGQP